MINIQSVMNYCFSEIKKLKFHLYRFLLFIYEIFNHFIKGFYHSKKGFIITSITCWSYMKDISIRENSFVF